MRSETMTDRELNEAIATYLFGAVRIDRPGGTEDKCWMIKQPKGHYVYLSCDIQSPRLWGPDSGHDSLPHFATSHNAAFAVVEKMRERGETDPVFIEFVRNLPSEDCVDLMFRLSPRLICLAALAAVKGEGKDFDDGPPCPICGSKSHGYTGHTPNHD